MRYCGHCGKQIKNETRFCPFCGRSVIDDLSVNDAAQNLSKEPLKKIKKTVAVIIIAVTLVVVIAAVCIAYFLKHENKKIDVQTFSDLSAQSESDTVSDEILDASDSPSPEVLYKDVLDFYYYGIASNWENVEKLQNNEYEVSDRLIDFCPDSSFIKQIGYMFADINDDGMDELFITADVDGVGGFCDLYTYMNGKAIHLLSCDGLSVYFLCEDNTLYVYSEGDDMTLYYGLYQLNKNSPDFTILEQFNSKWNDKDERYCERFTDGWTDEEGNSHFKDNMDIVSEKDAMDIISNEWPDHIEMDLKYFDEYASQNLDLEIEQQGYSQQQANNKSVPDASLFTPDLAVGESISYGTSIYQLCYKDQITWDSAQAYCMSLGGNLATITTQEEQEAVFSYIDKFDIDKDVWIGITDVNEEGNWSSWITGESMNYENWGSGEPDNGGEQDYGAICPVERKGIGYNIAPGQWDDLSMDSDTLSGYFLLEIDSNIKMENENLNENISQNIPQDAATFNGHSYYCYEEELSWKDAQNACETMGGHLATITSEEESMFIIDLIQSGDKYAYWLGGTDEKEEGVWKWITNEAWSYENWISGQPDNHSDVNKNTENYLAIERYKKAWNDVQNLGDPAGNNSLERTGYICEWDGI